jgi:hypothetical protein
VVVAFLNPRDHLGEIELAGKGAPGLALFDQTRGAGEAAIRRRSSIPSASSASNTSAGRNGALKSSSR